MKTFPHYSHPTDRTFIPGLHYVHIHGDYAMLPFLSRHLLKIARQVGGLTDFEQSVVSAMLADANLFTIDGHRLDVDTSRVADLVTLNPGGMLILRGWDAQNQSYVSWIVVQAVHGAAGVEGLNRLARRITNMLMRQGEQHLVAEGSDPQMVSAATWGFPITIRVLAEHATGSAIGLLPVWGTK